MKYRVNVMVATDVEADNEDEAGSMAIDKVSEAIGDDQDGGDWYWVTGVAHDFGEPMVFGRGSDE